MRYQAALFLIAALCAGTAASAQTTGSTVPDATQKSIGALYQLTCDAIKDPTDKNLNAAFASLAPGYVEIDPKGKSHKRDEVVASERMQLKQIEADDCTNTLASMSAPDAQTVVVVNTSHVTGSVQGQDGKHQLDATSKSSDTWKLGNGTWQLAQSKTLKELVKIDGNVVEDAGK